MDAALDALASAWDRMVELLFRRFDLLSYLGFALLALLANCGSIDVNVNLPDLGSAQTPPLATSLPPETPMLVGVLVFVTLGMLIGGLLLLAFVGLLLFVSSRATMMLIDSIIAGRPRFDGWHTHASAAWVLWRFRFAVAAVIGGFAGLGVATTAALALATELSTADLELTGLVEAITTGGFWLLGIPLLLIGFLLDFLARELVAPLLYVEQDSVLGALRRLRAAERFDFGDLVVYLLLRGILGFLVTLGITVVSCVLCCFLIIPGFGAVIFLPITIFLRALSMHWVASQGPDLRILYGATEPS